MNLLRYATRVAVRRVVAIVIFAFLAWAGIGRADAQEFVNCGDISFKPAVYCPDLQTAVSVLEGFAATRTALDPRNESCGITVTGNTAVLRMTSAGYSSKCPVGRDVWTRIGKDGCPAGTEWNEAAKQCFSYTECENRKTQPGFINAPPSARGFRSECIAGCTFKVTGANTSTGSGADLVVFGTFEWSGETCGIPPSPKAPPSVEEAKKPKKQECVPVAGQSVCLNDKGQFCQSASTGKQFCWRPGETGQKTDGADMQKRDPGNEAIPPNLNLPNGDTLVPNGQPTTTITKTVDAAGNTVINATTTTTNYKTTSGSDAGDKQQGEPADGSGKGGKGDGEGNGSTGGGDCKTAPVSTGDPILAAIVVQAWSTRCAIEGDVGADGGCDAAVPSCTGSKALCAIKNEQRKMLCDAKAEQQAFRDQLASDAQADDGHAGVDVGSIWGDGETGGVGIRTDLFGGGTSGSCDFSFSIGGSPVTMPPQFWTMASWINWLFVALAYIWVAGRVLD